MYLFTRQANLRGLDSPNWAVEIGAAAAAGLGNEVGVWANVLSPGFGTITWTSRWTDLSAIEKGFAALLGDAKYLDLAAKGAEILNGPINDTLYEVVYAGSGANLDARYAGTVSAVVAPGNFARGILGGIEIAQRAEKATGISTAFLQGQTGAYGSVVWLAGYEDMATFEAAQHALVADTSFIEYIDEATGAYQANPALTQSTLFMRLN
jgi:hypothetical protein